jgi:hypothetical protein
VGEAAKCFGLTARFPLPEIFLGKYRIHSLNKIFDAQETHVGLFTGDGDYRHKASFRNEKSSEAVPVPRLANGSGNSFIEGMQNGIERGNVGWVGRGHVVSCVLD